MIALLDANVLIALIDGDHTHHESAHKWWAKNIRHGWASCPLTENAVIRVMSGPNYPSVLRHTPYEILGRLNTFIEEAEHQFWPDDISLRDTDVFVTDRIHGPRQLTDVYLLGLATRNNGRLVTFDQRISLLAVREATPENLCMLM
jgi:uncharacterized protein